MFVYHLRASQPHPNLGARDNHVTLALQPLESLRDECNLVSELGWLFYMEPVDWVGEDVGRGSGRLLRCLTPSRGTRGL